MVKKKMRFGSMILAATLMVTGFSSLHVSASEIDTQQQPYLWNELTNTVRAIPTDEQVKDETVLNEPSIPSINKTENITPQAIFRYLERYDQSSAYVNYQYKYVNRVIGDNRLNLYTPLEIYFEAEKNGTFTLEGNISGQASAEKNLVVAKVNGTVSVGGAMSRSWTQGTKYGAKTSIPPKVRGALTGYIPGTSTNGQLVYKLVTDSTGEVRYEYVPMGGVVPSKTDWNIVPEIPFNG